MSKLCPILSSGGSDWDCPCVDKNCGFYIEEAESCCIPLGVHMMKDLLGLLLILNEMEETDAPEKVDE